MLIVRPDFDRRIDLPGAGPCPRPVDLDRSRTGFSDLVSLRVYSFAAGLAIDGEAEDDEVFIVLMRGRAEVAITQGGQAVEVFALAPGEAPRVVYMPALASYQLTATSGCDIAYARVRPAADASAPPRGFAPAAGRLEVIGHATRMNLTLAQLPAGGASSRVGVGRSPERFVHLRGTDGVIATIAGETLRDWDTVALDAGEDAGLTIEAGTAEILTISATTSRSDAAETP